MAGLIGMIRRYPDAEMVPSKHQFPHPPRRGQAALKAAASL